MKETDYKLKQAQDFEEKGQYLHALQIYLTLLSNEDSRRIVTIRLAYVYEKMNRNDKACEVIDSFLETFPDDEEVRIFYGHYLIRHGNYDKSLSVLSCVSAEKNKQVFYLTGLANYFLSEYKFAKINFELFVKSNPGSEYLPEANLFLAKILIKTNDYDAALEYAKKSESFLTQNFDVHLTQAKIFYFKEMFVHAYESINRAFSLNDSDCNVLKWGGKISVKLGEYKRAEYYLSVFISVCEPCSETYSLLGTVYMNNNKEKEAIKYFKKSLKLDPKNKEALKGVEKLQKK